MFNTIAIGTAKAKDFQLSEFIFAPGNNGNFSGSYIQANNNGLFLIHNFEIFVCLYVCVFVRLILFNCFLPSRLLVFELAALLLALPLVFFQVLSLASEQASAQSLQPAL